MCQIFGLEDFCELQLSCTQGLLSTSAHLCPLCFLVIISNLPHSLGFTFGTVIHPSVIHPSKAKRLSFCARPSALLSSKVSKRTSWVCLLLSLQTTREGGCIKEVKVQVSWPRPPSTVSFVKELFPRYLLKASLFYREIITCKNVLGIIVFLSIKDLFIFSLKQDLTVNLKSYEEKKLFRN